MQSSIKKAVNLLRCGGLVALPTETVYGLGADAKNPDALRKIFQAKQRPINHPLIVHLAEISQLAEWVSELSPLAQRLAEAFWPGPLTLILPKAPAVLGLITGGQQTVGVRIPQHPVALALLKQFGSGIAAPSANRFGRISPTTAAAVREELGDAVDLILEGGACEVGLESTIVDVSGAHPVILRPGMITAAQIEAIAHETLSIPDHEVPRVSGSLESHYAPVTRTQLLSAYEISQLMKKLTQAELPVALVVRTPVGLPDQNVTCVMMPADSKLYAHDLYQTLRELDHQQFKRIIVEDVPQTDEWLAIRDRLVKASFA
jgi:L-threonylcarbamoyladenylate synthase